MTDLTQVQQAIIRESSQNPIHKGMIRRVVKLRTEGLRLTRNSFDAQLQNLVQKGLLKRHGENYYSLEEASDVIFS